MVDDRLIGIFRVFLHENITPTHFPIAAKGYGQFAPSDSHLMKKYNGVVIPHDWATNFILNLEKSRGWVVAFEYGIGSVVR
uniref:Uncharacterized protein n=1 Tax=Romanomermis culicivorax TaxID=13658 RepID=A0A915J6F5_ROMCU